MADIEGYITKESAIEAITKSECYNCGVFPKNCGICKTNAHKKAILNVPAADVKPVVRGEWLEGSWDGKDVLMCDKCGYVELDNEPTNFCPHCGADMRIQEANNGP